MGVRPPPGAIISYLQLDTEVEMFRLVNADKFRPHTRQRIDRGQPQFITEVRYVRVCFSVSCGLLPAPNVLVPWAAQWSQSDFTVHLFHGRKRDVTRGCKYPKVPRKGC